MIWFDIDTLIREKPGGKKSIEDFCRDFFQADGDPLVVKTYGFDDVVKALNGVVAHDWKRHLEERLDPAGIDAPLDGLTRSGWRLDYQKKPNDLLSARQDEDKVVDLTASIGLLLKETGTVVDVVADRAADRGR